MCVLDMHIAGWHDGEPADVLCRSHGKYFAVHTFILSGRVDVTHCCSSCQRCHPVRALSYLHRLSYDSLSLFCRDIASYLSKVVDCNLPHLHLVSPAGGDPGGISQSVRKLETWGYCVVLFA